MSDIDVSIPSDGWHPAQKKVNLYPGLNLDRNVPVTLACIRVTT